jgi:8-oxo-dGTP pyrophosphatase MutT (NUDIX family)
MDLSPLAIRFVFTALHRLRRLLRAVTGSGRDGVHAVPLTKRGTVVLVRLTYAPGWRLPGGGRKRGEAQEAAMLRELREEIGLASYGAIELLDDVRAGPGLPEERSALFLLRGVDYRPRRSLEIEAVAEFDPDRPPPDTAPWTLQVLAGLKGLTPPPAG